MFKFNLKYFVFFSFILTVLSLLIFQPLTKQETALSILQNQYKGSFTTTSEKIGKYLITSAYSTTQAFIGDTLVRVDKEASPLVMVQDFDTHKILAIYEIGINNNSTDSDTGNLIQVSQSVFENIDNDKEKEFIGEWTISYGGSGGLQALVVFDFYDDEFIPILGYPASVDEKNSIVFTERVTQKTFSFPVFSSNNFSHIKDINNDGISEWLYGTFDWNIEESEAHFDPHFWNLQVLTIDEGKFKIPKWWNKGETYTTKERIGFEEDDRQNILELFDSLQLKKN